MSIQLYLPEERFAVVSLPLEQYGAAVESLRALTGFVALTRDKDEVSLVISEDEWGLLSPRFPMAITESGRRLIRFDTVLDFSVVGFIAEVSRALADADISILSISTFRTDAVLVHEAQFNAAVAAVKRALVTLQFSHLAQH